MKGKNKKMVGRWYSEKEAGKILNLSYGYLKALRLKKLITCIRFGRAVRYTEGNLEEFIKRREQRRAHVEDASVPTICRL